MFKRLLASVAPAAIVIVVAALLALVLGRDAHAATLTVVNTNDSGAGSLRQAIADAAPSDTINFNPGMSGQTITLTSGELDIGKDLTIAGPAGGITVSGNNASQVFTIGSGVTVSMSYLTISNGSAADGGISNNGTLNLRNSTVSGNTGDGAGGISNNGTLILTNSTVSGNSAVLGGGISNGGMVTLLNSTVSGNSAVEGGGIINFGTLTVTNSTFSGNSTVKDDDRDRSGGAINNQAGLANLTNVTISGNSAKDGGGIINFAMANLTDVTVSGNSATHYGGGVVTSGGTLNLTNSIVANQVSGGDCFSYSPITSLGYNLDSDGSCSLTATGDLPNTNPMLGPLALNAPGTTQTQALLAGSPAINQIPVGVNGCGTTIVTDQRGVVRPVGSGCDIGAYEIFNCTKSDSTAVYRPWTSPAGDDDCDGFTTTIENFVGTDPNVACGGTALPDGSSSTWPPDLNNDGRANISDILKYIPVFNTTGPNPPYKKRYDLNGDNKINISDVLKFSPFFNQSCTP